MCLDSEFEPVGRREGAFQVDVVGSFSRIFKQEEH